MRGLGGISFKREAHSLTYVEIGRKHIIANKLMRFLFQSEKVDEALMHSRRKTK